MTEPIAVDPDLCNGRPVITATRFTAQTVIEFLTAGDSPEDIIAEYPSLTREDILACLAYSVRLFSHQPHSQRIELASVLRLFRNPGAGFRRRGKPRDEQLASCVRTAVASRTCSSGGQQQS